jgi:hypothetical protein
MQSTRLVSVAAVVIALAAVVSGLALAVGACGGQGTAAPSPSDASPSAKGGVNASGRGVHLTVHWLIPTTVDVSGDGATASMVAQGGAVEFEGQSASGKDVYAKLGDVVIVGNNPGLGRPDLTLHVGNDGLDPISMSEGTGRDQWIGKVKFHLQRDQDNGAGTKMFQVWVSRP